MVSITQFKDDEIDPISIGCGMALQSDGSTSPTGDLDRDPLTPLILIVGGYGGGTTGDEITLDAALSQLGSLYPVPNVIILSPQPELTRWMHPGWRVVGLETENPKSFITPLQKVKALARARLNPYACQRYLVKYYFNSLSKVWQFDPIHPQGHPTNRISKLIHRADAMYCVGGGYLHSMDDLGWVGTILKAWQSHGKPLFISPVGMMPMWPGPNEQMLASVFRDATHSSVRDQASYNWATARAGVREGNCSLDVDDAIWYLPKVRDSLPNRSSIIRDVLPEGVKAFGFGWCPLFAGAKFDETKAEVQFAELLDYLCEKYDLHAVGIPMHLDRSVDFVRMNRLCSRSKNPSRIHILQPQFMWKDVAGMLNSLEFIVSSRFHLLIMSLSCGVPALAVHAGEYYGVKNKSVMRWFDRDSWSIDVTQFNKEDVSTQISNLLQRREFYMNELLESSNTLGAKANGSVTKLKEIWPLTTR